MLGQDLLAFEEGARVKAIRQVRIRQPAGHAHGVVLLADLDVGLLQNIERLAVVGLCLGDNLKHLDRLQNLRALFAGQIGIHWRIRLS